ncbi:MAG: hypothetical protein CVU60_13120 [Deltaproteobacteria bacterium HGW-Deltaproteobacteria-18]|jgi:three-Cys-motif partner protein|nr:MAG: hypothetical protein CVU60_13120 [Deltaproteobacteria bacterium HGW-Deltaproteobacteria-18]
MKKNLSKAWSNVRFCTWEYEKQTEMKHKVIKYYLPIWAKILNKKNMPLSYIDGFGGIGAYHTMEDVINQCYKSNNYGSPIFSMQEMSNLLKKDQIKSANAIIIDKKISNIENIKKIVEHIGIHNVNVNYIHGDFDIEINKFLDKVKVENGCPNFFLIDPFGFTIKLDTLRRIMSLPATEILINFMYNAISRHIKNENYKINNIYDELFGVKNWRNFADVVGEEKELALVNLFRDQCKKFAKFVYPFKLNFPEINRPYYYLFHLSNNYLGCKLMKEAFAANNKGEFEYRGNRTVQHNFLSSLGGKHNIPQFNKLCGKCFILNKKNYCRACIAELIDQKTITFENFVEKIVDTIPFTEKEIKNMVNDFEAKQFLRIVSTRRRRSGLERTDILNFI